MNITVYTITYNEEKVLPFFLDHYSKFATSIVIYDNESTDNTTEIASRHPLVKDIRTTKTSNSLDDRMYIDVKNTCWKGDDSDYVIIVDADELLYHHESVLNYLDNTKYPVYKPTGYNMITESFPHTGKPITEQVNRGSADTNYSKPVIFNPKLIDKVSYELGAHTGRFFNNSGQEVIPVQSEFKLLHYKNLSIEYRLQRHRMFTNRLSDFNRTSGAGIHYTWSDDIQIEEFNKILESSEIVI